MYQMVDDNSDVNSLLVVPISRVGLHRSDEDILFDAPICNKKPIVIFIAGQRRGLVPVCVT